MTPGIMVFIAFLLGLRVILAEARAAQEVDKAIRDVKVAVMEAELLDLPFLEEQLAELEGPPASPRA